MNKKYYNLGRNIKTFRKLKKMNQAELGKKVGVSDSLVSDWERGIKIPDEKILQKICQTLGISKYSLLECNNKNITSETEIELSNEELKTKLEKELNIIIPLEQKTTNKSTHFNKGLELHKQFLNDYTVNKTSEIIEIEPIKEILYYYNKSLEKNIEEAANNILALFYFLVLHDRTKNIDDSIIENSINTNGKSNKIKITEALSIQYELTNSNTKKDTKKTNIEMLIEEKLTLIWICVALLKQSKEYFERGDFYLVNLYLYNYTINDRSPEENYLIGQELNRLFKILQNPYL